MLYRQRIFKKTLIIDFVIILLTTTSSLYSQSFNSRDNYTGNWEDSLSWIPVWNPPLTSISSYDITINGYITVNGDLTLFGASSTLIINDTLVIHGDLTLGNNTNVIINDNGILIVQDSLKINNQTIITANGYLIVSNSLFKLSSINQGSITSNDDPVKIFICGTISDVGLTDDNIYYPAINCSTPMTFRYPNSNCSYGNLYDLMNDPVHYFYQQLCPVWVPEIYAGGPLSFCDGDSVILISGAEVSYLWSTGDTTQSISAKISGSYSVITTDTDGCESLESVPVIVNVIDNPLANAGPDQDLVYVFTTEMNATPVLTGSGEWSVISGSGIISDVNSPTTTISGLSAGINTFSWKVQNGTCESTDDMTVEVNDIVTPTVFTPNNDGLNDVLVFPGLSAFPGSKIIIYDRWGNEVYKSLDYLNDWDGKDKKNRDLQPDTYYYILNISNGRTIKGFIEIRR